MLPSNNLHTIFFPYFDICGTLISVLEGTEIRNTAPFFYHDADLPVMGYI